MGLLELIASGIGIIASLTTIFKNTQYSDSQSNTPHNRTIQNIENRLFRIESKMSKRQINIQECVNEYNSLIKILKANNAYNRHLVFVPTSYGTWKIFRKKPLILRDSSGEYNTSK